MKGSSQKVRFLPRSSGKTNIGGISRDFCSDIPVAPEKFEEKKVCAKSCPLYLDIWHFSHRSERYHKIRGFGELFGHYSARMVGP